MEKKAKRFDWWLAVGKYVSLTFTKLHNVSIYIIWNVLASQEIRLFVFFLLW